MPRKRRAFSAEFKAKVVLELLSGEKSLMEASREYSIKDTLLSRWKQEFLAKAAQLFEQPKEVQEKDARIAELERMVGRLTMKIELQKKVLSYAPSQLQDKE
jgi:transposase-like protein